VIEFDGIDIDQVPLTTALRVIEEGLNRAPVSEGVPIAPVDTIVVMKLIAGRTQDLADVEAIIASGADRELLTGAVRRAALHRVYVLERLFGNVDREARRRDLPSVTSSAAGAPRQTHTHPRARRRTGFSSSTAACRSAACERRA
jgi:hypothetical protein